MRGDRNASHATRPSSLPPDPERASEPGGVHGGGSGDPPRRACIGLRILQGGGGKGRPRLPEPSRHPVSEGARGNGGPQGSDPLVHRRSREKTGGGAG